MFRVHSTVNDDTYGFYFLVYGFRCNEMQRIDEQIGSDQHFLFFPLLIYTRPRMQALRFIHLSCINNGHYFYRRSYF